MYLFCRCFLRSHFQWFFTAPVIIVLAINILFLIMASAIMWKQANKRLTKNEDHHFFNWLKSVISLAVIMGLTWIVGVVIIAREELAPLAYIYTIAVAFQGFLMFLVLIVFVKPVRDDIKTWFEEKLNSKAKQTVRVTALNFLDFKKILAVHL